MDGRCTSRNAYTVEPARQLQKRHQKGRRGGLAGSAIAATGLGYRRGFGVRLHGEI
jgi:hypothetical protein